MDMSTLLCTPKFKSQIATCHFATWPQPGSANHPNTSSVICARLLTVAPVPSGPGSILQSTGLCLSFKTSQTTPAPILSSSQHRNICSATSSGCTHTSCCSSNSVIFSGWSVHSGVLITPGATPFTRMPKVWSRGSRLWMKPEMACLEAMYNGNGKPGV